MASQRNKRTSPYGTDAGNPGRGVPPAPLPKTMTASQRMSQMQGQNNRPNERNSVPINEILNNPGAPRPFSRPGKPLTIPEAFARLDEKISLVEEILESKGIEVEKSKVDKFTTLERKIEGVLKRFFTQEQLESHLAKTSFTKTQINFALQNLRKEVATTHALQSDLDALRKMTIEKDDKLLELETRVAELTDEMHRLKENMTKGDEDLTSTTAIHDEESDTIGEESVIVELENKEEENEEEESEGIEKSASSVSLDSSSSPRVVGDITYQQEIEMEIKEKTVKFEEEEQEEQEEQEEEVKEVVEKVVEEVADKNED